MCEKYTLLAFIRVQEIWLPTWWGDLDIQSVSGRVGILSVDAYCCLVVYVNGSAFNLLLGRSHISPGGQEQWPVWYPPNPSNSTMVSYCPLNIFLYFGHDGGTLSSCLGTDWKTCIRGSTWRWYTISPSDCKYLMIWFITATFWNHL